jgi:hypothetical protein
MRFRARCRSRTARSSWSIVSSSPCACDARKRQARTAMTACCLHGRPRMEHLWSRAVATGGNRSRMGWQQKRLQQAKTLAVGCHWLPIGAHGKEGVDGSSPSEGFRKPLQ